MSKQERKNKVQKQRENYVKGKMEKKEIIGGQT